MAASGSTVRINIVGDSSGLSRGLNDADRELGGFGDKVKGNAAKIGGAMAGAFAVDAVVGFGKSILDGASDVNESMNKVQAVFGPSAKAIDDFSKTAADKLGLSRREALAAAGGFGNMFDQLKIAPTVSADMSKGLMTLAADLGSFNNASTPEVVDAMTSAFRGEYDSLQRFIPTINAAAVQQKALEQTHKSSASALTDSEKALATYTLMQEGAGKAAGDFAKTAEDPANALKRAQKQWEDGKDSLGLVLLPVMGKVAAFMADNLPAAIKAGSSAFTWLKENILPPLSDAFGWFKDNVLPGLQTGWQAVQQFLQSPEAIEGFAKVQEAINGIRNFINEVMPQVRDAITTVINGIQVQWHLWGDDLMNVISGAFNIVKSVVEFVINTIANTIRFVLAVINGDWGKAWDAVKNQLENAWNLIKGVVSGGLEIIKGYIGGVGSGIKAAASGMWDGIKDAFAGALNWIIDKWNGFHLSAKVPDNPMTSALGIAGKGFDIDTPFIPHFAKGGWAPENQVIEVGEKGPEFISLSRPGFVHTATETAAIKAAAAGGSSRPVTYAPTYGDFKFYGSDEAMVQKVRDMLDERDEEFIRVLETGLAPT